MKEIFFLHFPQAKKFLQKKKNDCTIIYHMINHFLHAGSNKWEQQLNLVLTTFYI
jgi:hypothetical protein